MYRMNADLAEALLDALKDALDGGRIYVFAGPVPATPDVAHDMGADLSQVAMFTLNGAGVTGLTLAAPADHTITKTPSESWRGLVAFDGADDGETTLTPTFFRFCPSGDNGRAAGAGPRLQGTVGGPNSTANMRLASDTLTDNGSNETGVAGWTYSLLPVS